MSTDTNAVTPLRAIRAHWRRILLVVVALILAGGAVYYFGFVHIYKSDYSSMLREVNDTTTAYNGLLSARDEAIGKLSAEDQAFNSTVEQYRQTNTKYRDTSTTLGGARALKDATVRTAYNTFTQQNTKFFAYVQDQLDLLPLVHGVTINCSEAAPSKLNTSDLAKIADVYDQAMKSCSDAMVALSKSSNSSAATLAKENVVYFAAMRAHATAMQEAYGAGNRTKFESEYNALLEALAQYKSHIQVRGFLDIDKNVVPTAELNALAKLLGERQK